MHWRGPSCATFVLTLLACEPAPLDHLPCPCAQGYFCCYPDQVCKKEICVGADDLPWPNPAPDVVYQPISMDAITVFASSHVDTNGTAASREDPQVLTVHPDMVVGGWGQWRSSGVSSGNYDNGFVRTCQAQSPAIRFMGGGTATALFMDQVAPDNFADFVTSDASGRLVKHDDLNQDEYRATLANPAFRAELVRIGKIQIDQGVDGLQYSDVNAGYQGTPIDGGTRDGNEGFDVYHLADFNSFLLNKFPDGEYARRFEMTPDNLLNTRSPAGDLTNNFNFRKYLAARNQQSMPLGGGSPLAAEWGGITPDRPQPGNLTFVDSAEPYRYWRQIVQELRNYATTSGGRTIFVSANGIFPFVDFFSYGFYDSGAIHPPEFAEILPPEGGLNGAVSLQSTFVPLRSQGAAVVPGAPIVLSLDGRWDRYHELTQGQRWDFWRIYAAEAYANGLFFAFLLKAPTSGKTDAYPEKTPNTATVDGTMPLFTALARFYRGHQDLYHHVTPLTGADPPPIWASTSADDPTPKLLAGAMVSISDQDSPHRRIVHIVNHQYQPDAVPAAGDIPASGLVTQSKVRLSIPIAQPVVSAFWVSPDNPGSEMPLDPLPPQTPNELNIELPTLAAYDVVVLSYGDQEPP